MIICPQMHWTDPIWAQGATRFLSPNTNNGISILYLLFLKKLLSLSEYGRTMRRTDKHRIRTFPMAIFAQWRWDCSIFYWCSLFVSKLWDLESGKRWLGYEIFFLYFIKYSVLWGEDFRCQERKTRSVFSQFPFICLSVRVLKTILALGFLSFYFWVTRRYRYFVFINF